MMECVNDCVRDASGVLAERKRKWPTLIYPGCSLVWLVQWEHLAASHSLPLSPGDHRSPTSFLQGHKYFPPGPHTAFTSSSRRRLMTAKDRQCILSLRSYTFHKWLKLGYLLGERPAATCPPQTLHLKWYIKATCRKTLYMIDVGNDSVFLVWKSYVFLTLHSECP